MRKLKNRNGEVHQTYQGFEIIITDYRGANDISVQFNDELGTVIEKAAYKEVKQGNIKNPNHPSVYDIGYIGQGKYKARKNSKQMYKSYNSWFAMMTRCYNKKHLQKHPSYKNCSVDPVWHNFQTFAKWYFSIEKEDTWHLDKDIIVKGNKVYSPNTCCFVPNEVNVLFSGNNTSTTGKAIGVHPKDGKFQTSISKYNTQVYIGYFDTELEAYIAYKNAKKDYMAEIADKWENILDSKVIKSLRNFEVDSFSTL